GGFGGAGHGNPPNLWSGGKIYRMRFNRKSLTLSNPPSILTIIPLNRIQNISKRDFSLTPPPKVLFTRKRHTNPRANGAAQSKDGFLDLKLAQPHPAAENLFGAAWSACHLGAIQLAATQRKIKLPDEPAVDAEIELNLAGSSFFLRA